MFFDLNEDLTYNPLILILIGGRGIGKSYSLKKHVVNRYLKNGEQFIYLRRYSQELQDTAPTYFNDWNRDNPERVVEYKNGGHFYINGELCGYSFSLSLAQKLKSSSFPCVTTIIFEEFLIETGLNRYINNEPFKLLELYETVARMRENVRILMAANAVTMHNPYFLDWGLYLPDGKDRLYKDGILLHKIESSPDFVAAKESTRFGKLSKTLNYSGYSISNEYLLDQQAVLEPLTPFHRYFVTLYADNQPFGCWLSKEGTVVISRKGDITFPAQIKIKKGFTKRVLNNGRYANVFASKISNALLTDTIRFTDNKTAATVKPYLSFFL